MVVLTSQKDHWTGYEPLPILELQLDPNLLQIQVRRVEECKAVQQQSIGGGFHYNVFGRNYKLEKWERKAGDAMCVGSLLVASIEGRIHAFLDGGHSCRSGGKIGYPEFKIDVKESDSLFQRLKEIPTSSDLFARNKKALKYGRLTGQPILEPKTDPKREAWCEQMWKRGWMFDAEEDSSQRFQKCMEMVPTLEHVLKYYLIIR